jgi:CheY-like chemotaxis protein
MFVQGERGLDRREGGLGIGLTLVRKLVTLHGGTVTAASDGPGRGSTLTVRIPSMAAPTAAAGSGAAQPIAARRVVVIEDNDDAREMLAMLLRLQGHEVHVASSGGDGVRCAAAVLPDAVLVDIGLPDVDGYTVAQRLRQLPIGEKMLLVAISGYGQREDRRHSKEAGFDVHLVKPVDPDRLHRLIGEHSPRTA